MRVQTSGREAVSNVLGLDTFLTGGTSRSDGELANAYCIDAHRADRDT
jgi:hypothetical protein